MEDKIRDFILYFTSILYEAMPFIILGAVLAGILEEFVPQRFIARIIPGNRFLAIGLSGFLGAVFPMCECGIVVVMRRLLRKGLPLSCCVAYLLAGPIINVIVLASTYVAFSGMEERTTVVGGTVLYQMGGMQMMFSRALIAYLVAIGTAIIIEFQYRKHGDSLLTPLAQPSRIPVIDDEDNGKHRPFFVRLGSISETSLHDFVDITTFLILGALLSALMRQIVTHRDVEDVARAFPALSILIMMGLALLLCLCSEADAFVAASLTALRPSAKLGFLVFGPMMDLKLYLMYTRIFRPRLIWTIISSVAIQVFVYCMLTHFIWDAVAPHLLPLPETATPVEQTQPSPGAPPA